LKLPVPNIKESQKRHQFLVEALVSELARYEPYDIRNVSLMPTE